MSLPEITALYDPDKPYARFYQVTGEIIAQVHTRRIEGLGFGRVGWRISASVCGPDGATLEDEEGLQILRGADGGVYRHEVTVQAETVEDLAALLEAERQTMAQRAANAAEVWRSAQDLL